MVPEAFKLLWTAVADELKKIDKADEQYYTDRRVEERLKELKKQGEEKFERQAHTYLSLTGQNTFSSKIARQGLLGHSDYSKSQVRRSDDRDYSHRPRHHRSHRHRDHRRDDHSSHSRDRERSRPRNHGDHQQPNSDHRYTR